MATVKKKIAKSSITLKKGGNVSKYKKGGTVKKAQEGYGASAISSQSNCTGGDCKKDKRGDLGPGPSNIFDKMRDVAAVKKFNKVDRKEFDRQYAARDTSGAAARSAKFQEEERGRAEDVATANRMSSQRNKVYPYKDTPKIYDSLQNVRKTRPISSSMASTSGGSSEGKSTGEYLMGQYKKGGKLVKKASSKSMKMGGTVKKSAVKKAVVKKTIKSKSKKK